MMYRQLNILIMRLILKRLYNLVYVYQFIVNTYMQQYDARKQSLMSEGESQKVEIYFTARNISSLTKAALQIYLQETNQPRKLIMRTKPAQNLSRNIDFTETLILDYFFEIRQKLIVEMRSEDSSSREIVGAVEATVGEIFKGRAKGIVVNLSKAGDSIGSMHLKCEKVQKGNNAYVEFDLVSSKIDAGSSFLCFGVGKVLWRMYKTRNNQQYLIDSSESLEGGDNRYPHKKISERKLCNNDIKQLITVKFFNQNVDSAIGQATFTLASVVQGTKDFNLMRQNSNKGSFKLQNFSRGIKYDFRDYYQGGMELALFVGIDFTASNGSVTQPTSLHYYDQYKRSTYEEALYEICSIMMDYDKDQLVPTFGFGAKVHLPTFQTNQNTHHCFPINGTVQNPNIYQLNGIVEAYRKCLPLISLSGPTLFSPMLREAMIICQKFKKDTKQYMVLMIMTDGVIHDFQEVKDLLVACGRLPLSIIIIGIGYQQDWKDMHDLDDDRGLMTDSKGRRTERDLVQFVEFAKHNNNGVQLAREVLQELPRQVEEYHRLVGIKPEAYRKNLISDIDYQRRSGL